MLEVHEVTKVYDGRPVVNHVSFEVHPGEIFALLGPNGAGKTTLIRMITDILRPDSGTITLDGHSVSTGPRERIAYLPEERGLYRKVQVLDALAYYGELKGLSRHDATTTALALLEAFELRDVGEQAGPGAVQGHAAEAAALHRAHRRAAAAHPRRAVQRPRPAQRAAARGRARRRRAAGTTVLLSTHQMNKVEQQCDRALMINRGHMVLYGHGARDAPRSTPSTPSWCAPPRRRRKVAGVREVAPDNDAVRLVLEPTATPSGVLRELLDAGVEVESFEHAVAAARGHLRARGARGPRPRPRPERPAHRRRARRAGRCAMRFSWKRALIIARREYLTTVRKKAFLITLHRHAGVFRVRRCGCR